MNDYPNGINLSCVRDAANKADEKNGNDIRRAAMQLSKEIRKRPDFESLVGEMLEEYFLWCIYRVRHHRNRSMRAEIEREISEDPPPLRKRPLGRAKVVTGRSKVATAVHKFSLLKYRCNGCELGEIFGRQLPEMIDTESKLIRGHEFNVRLFEYLREHVAPNQKVKNVFGDRELRRVFKELGADTIGGLPVAV